MGHTDNDAADSAYDQLEVWLKTRHPRYESRLPGETLLSIPSSALLNPLSLRTCTLNTISLHLFPLTVSPRNGGANGSANRLKGRKQAGNSTLPRPRSASTARQVIAPDSVSQALGPSGTTSASTAIAPETSDGPFAPSSSSTHSSSSNRKRPRLSIASRLNTTQLLSLHLLLTRDPTKRHPSGWEIYIRTLPEFDTHPLSMLYPPRDEEAKVPRAGIAGDSVGAGGNQDVTGRRGVWSWYGESGDDNEDGKATEGIAAGVTVSPMPRLRRGSLPSAVRVGGDAARLRPLDCLTRGAREKLKDVQERYEGDKAAILTVLRAEEPFKSQGIVDDLYEHDLLWAWLNVNTRSVSIPLGFQNTTNNTQNHTLVPILDMLNHSSDVDRVIASPRQMPSAPSVAVAMPADDTAPATTDAMLRAAGTTLPDPTPPLTSAGPSPSGSRAGGFPGVKSSTAAGMRGSTSGALVPGRIGLELVAPSRGIKADEEVMFTYGPHCSSTLFAEYGFSELALSPAVTQRGQKSEAAELARHASQGGAGAGTTSASPPVPPASMIGIEALGRDIVCNWRDLMNGQLDVGWLVDEMWEQLSEEDKEEREDALRMIGCHRRNTLHTYRPPPSPSHSLLMTLRLLHHPTPIPSLRLRAIRSGSISYFGPEVEDKVTASLRTICERVAQETEEGLEQTRKLVQQERMNSEDKEGRVDGYTLQQLEALWIEQGGIAGAVLQRIMDGDTDW